MSAARVLIADDDPHIRALLKDFLESKRCEVLEATDGAQAFAVAEAEVPHLIIMDVVMPGVYGSAASRRLQDDWRTSKIPIIVISGTSDAPVAKLMAANPLLRFLPKPLDLERLGRTIDELLPAGGYRP